MKPTALATTRHLSPLLLCLLLMGCRGLMDATRTFYLTLDPGPWSEYDLLIELPGRSVPIESTLWPDGTLRWISDPLGEPPAGMEEPGSFEMRCHAE